MKTLTALTAVFLLILAIGAFAADKTTIPQTIPTVVTNGAIQQSIGFTGLKINPMIAEIDLINQAMQERESSLLTALTNAQTELQANRIIQQITQLDVDRELAILRVQMRFARLDGRLALASEIKEMIISIVNNDLVALR